MESDMTYADLAFPFGWLINGIVYLTGLFLLTPLTHLKLDWINFGTIKILYMILEHSCREPEVVAKCCVRNFNNLVYCKVISRCGHRGCARKLRLRLRLFPKSVGYLKSDCVGLSFFVFVLLYDYKSLVLWMLQNNSTLIDGEICSCVYLLEIQSQRV